MRIHKDAPEGSPRASRQRRIAPRSIQRLRRSGALSRELWLLLPALAGFLAALVYGGTALGGALQPADTAQAVWAATEERVGFTAVILREERLLVAGETAMRPLTREGERVAAGTELAIVYSTGPEYLRASLLLRLRRSYLRSQGAGEAALSEAALRQAAGTLRSAASHRAFDAAAEEAEALRAALFDGREAAALLPAEIASLEAAGGQDAVLAAPAAGWVSARSDGRENLSPAGWKDLDAAELSAALSAQSAGIPGVLRLVTGSGWLLCARLSPQEAGAFAPGGRFSLTLDGLVQAQGEVLGLLPEEGATWVLFSCREGVEAVLSLRTTAGSSLLSRTEGWRLPAAALHEEGETRWIYRLAGPFVRREEVELLAREGENILVGSALLREGALVLTDGKEYTDGELY